MTRWRVFILVPVLIPTTARADVLQQLQEGERLLGETTALLKSIKAGVSTEAAVRRLERLDKQLEEMGRTMQKLDPDGKHVGRMRQAAGGLEKEMMRLDIDPKTPKAVRDARLFRRYRESLAARAKADCNALSSQVEIYKLN